MGQTEFASANLVHEVETQDHALSLEHVESDPGRFRGVALPLLLPGTALTLHTRNTCYRMVVVDASERRVRITGGKLFPEGTEATVVGAIDDESVKVGWIVAGFQLELATPRGPVLTSVVESVGVAS
jgi:TATA-box binding protein (TBP) (component of TFIID and TFIIIB)